MPGNRPARWNYLYYSFMLCKNYSSKREKGMNRFHYYINYKLSKSV